MAWRWRRPGGGRGRGWARRAMGLPRLSSGGCVCVCSGWQRGWRDDWGLGIVQVVLLALCLRVRVLFF